MKLPYSLIMLLFLSFSAFAQQTENDSVIYLKEVVTNKPEEKTIKIKTKGEELASTFEGGIKSRICLVDELPEGKIQSVKMYFNSGLINLAKKSLNVQYKDTELRLVMYEVGSDGLPGKLITSNDLQFIVKQDHKGALELDLSSFNIHAPGKFFIGIELLEDTIQYTPIVLKVVANNDGVTYIKNTNSPDWSKDTTFPNQIRLELKIKP